MIIMFRSILMSAFVFGTLFCNGQYNDLWIPDTLSGTAFNLTLQESTKQFRPGAATVTSGVNGDFWGPTLFMNKGDVVQMNVQNDLTETSTLHWHGMHLPAIMDGGPHQVIPAGSLWQPYWEVKNKAATYWYHPHLHSQTNAQMTAGIGGFIIVRDEEEAALPLPRTYGVDDFPLNISDRRFTSGNQFVVTNYTDSLIVNGTLSPQLEVPAQVVRFRLLNTSPQHSYNLGFADNRSFSVIASDGGLLDNPVALTRFILCPGERVEILVDFGGQANQTINLMAYNNSLASDITGAPITQGPSDALLGLNFRILHFIIGEPEPNAIITIPTDLVTNEIIDESSADMTRTITMIDGFLNGFPNTSFDGEQFDMDVINHTVQMGNTEIWEIVSNSNIAHTFHIHDVQFNTLSRIGSTTTLQPYDMGWKDNILIRAGETLRFIAKFEDYADPIHPFMYHCHMTVHEDEGMMGQFLVVEPTGLESLEMDEALFSIYPNPAKDKLFVINKEAGNLVSYLTITDALGRMKLMLPVPQLKDGIDISQLSKGIYTVHLTNQTSRRISSLQLVKE